MSVYDHGANRLVAALWNDLQRDLQATELAKIRANPSAHRATRIMADGKPASYRYYRAGYTKSGDEIRYCYTVHRNAVDLFLFFREIIRHRKRTRERDQFAGRKRKSECIALARRRAKQDRKRLNLLSRQPATRSKKRKKH